MLRNRMTLAILALALFAAPTRAQAFSLYAPYHLTIQGATVCSATPTAGQLLVYNGTQFCGVPGVQQFTSNTTFTTDANVPWYEVIVVGAGGGGGSSSGAGYGGNGGLPAVSYCDVLGGGAQYEIIIGAGGPAGAAGASGVAGAQSRVRVVGNSTSCNGNAGYGGTAGTASNGAGGIAATVASPGAILDNSSPANTIGHLRSGFAGGTGGVGGAAEPTVLGVTSGVGCAGANCTTNTAGANGVVWMIPVY